MSVSFRARGCLLVILCCQAAAPAVAQESTAGKKWEVEAHGGGLWVNDPSGGTPIAQFPVGGALATGAGTATTRAVSSWYFGDGALLLNQVSAGFATPVRLIPLDAALKQRLAKREDGGNVGFRVTRDLTRRFAAEFNFDYSPTALRLTDAAGDGIEAARLTYIGTWNAVLATGATANRTVTSTSDVTEGDGRQLSLTGALRIRFLDTARLRPYATVGGGAVFYSGTTPGATLTGNYGFSFAGLFPFNERDVVTVKVRAKDRVPVGVFGGGIQYDASPRHGLRADVRVHVGADKVDTVVSANPSVTLQSPTFAIATAPGIPSIQFSNSGSINRQSSLSGPAIADLPTFTGSGTQTQVYLTVGYFVRF